MHTTPGVGAFACGLLLGVLVSRWNWNSLVTAFFLKGLGYSRQCRKHIDGGGALSGGY